MNQALVMSTMVRKTRSCRIVGDAPNSDNRHFNVDLLEKTFPRFCDELLSLKSFVVGKEFGPERIPAPDWDICMTNELEIRHETTKLSTEEGYSSNVLTTTKCSTGSSWAILLSSLSSLVDEE